MIRLLVYIKHNLLFVWDIIEWFNSLLFYILYGKSIKRVIYNVLKESSDEIQFKLLGKEDMHHLAIFFEKQPESAFIFFKPHPFDLKSLLKKKKDSSFIMIGAFDKNELVGYCFLRCFFNKQAFRGKIVDVEHQGRGIAKKMGIVMTEICKKMKFRIFATISKDNVKSIASSKAVNEMKIIKELPDNYLYVEYL